MLRALRESLVLCCDMLNRSAFSECQACCRFSSNALWGCCDEITPARCIRWLRHWVMFYILHRRAPKYYCTWESAEDGWSKWSDRSGWTQRGWYAARVLHTSMHLTANIRTSPRSPFLRRSSMPLYPYHSNMETFLACGVKKDNSGGELAVARVTCRGTAMLY